MVFLRFNFSMRIIEILTIPFRSLWETLRKLWKSPSTNILQQKCCIASSALTTFCGKPNHPVSGLKSPDY